MAPLITAQYCMLPAVCSYLRYAFLTFGYNTFASSRPLTPYIVLFVLFLLDSDGFPNGTLFIFMNRR